MIQVKNESFVEPILLNLNVKRDLEQYRQIRTVGHLFDALDKQCNLTDFISTGVYYLHFGKYVLVSIPSCWSDFAVCKDNVVYPLNVDWKDKQSILKGVKETLEKYAPAGVLVTPSNKFVGKAENNKGKKVSKNEPDFPAYILMTNADESGTESVDKRPYESIVDDALSGPTLSFTCLNRFYEDVKIADVVQWIADGRLELIDFTEDKWSNAKKRPGLGYTKVGRQWHQPSSVLLYDNKEKMSLLFGIDDDSYFGVELPTNPKNIKEAFDLLAPEAVRKAIRKGRVVTRQGEWYAIEILNDEIPPVEDCVLEFGGNISNMTYPSNIALGRDHEESSYHVVEAEMGRVGKDGLVYAHSPCLEHSNGDHPEMVNYGWVVYHRNTAIRSFSVEGVD